MHEPVVRASGSGMSENFGPARAHHAAQRRNHRTAFRTGQATYKSRGADGLTVEMEMPCKIVAEPDRTPPLVQLPEKCVTATYALRSLAVCHTAAKPIDQPLSRRKRGAHLLWREWGREEMSRASFKKRGRPAESLSIDEGNQSAAARFDRWTNGRDQPALAFRSVPHVHYCNLGIAMEKALRRVGRPPCGNDAPACLPRDMGQSITIPWRQDEKAALSMQCGFTAHIKTPGARALGADSRRWVSDPFTLLQPAVLAPGFAMA